MAKEILKSKFATGKKPSGKDFSELNDELDQSSHVNDTTNPHKVTTEQINAVAKMVLNGLRVEYILAKNLNTILPFKKE